jgi:uncharacterized membrane protein
MILRFGLGLTFILIGVNIFRSPNTWIGYLPTYLPVGISRESMLQITGLADLALGLLLIVRIWPRVAGFLIAVHILAILVTNGFDAVLIRDVGLLGMALAVTLWPVGYKKKHWWSKKSKSKGSEE